MSGLTKKMIYADKTLSSILGVSEGTLVSYSDVSKGIHSYIKKKDLTKLRPAQTEPSLAVASTVAPQTPVELESAVCKDCGESIPSDAIFCDMCGVKQ